MAIHGQQLVFNDGTIIAGQAGYSQGFLWCHFTGYTLQEAALIFFDTNKTSRITFQYGEMEDVYEGYTNCIHLSIDTDGEVAVCLKQSEPILT